jgi:hypothetical protein
MQKSTLHYGYIGSFNLLQQVPLWLGDIEHGVYRIAIPLRCAQLPYDLADAADFGRPDDVKYDRCWMHYFFCRIDM